MNKNYLCNTFSLTKKKFKNNTMLNNHKEMRNAHFYYDDDTSFNKYKNGESSIILVGYILDIRDENRSENEILRDLLKSYIDNLEEFYNDFEYMNGRFILIFDTEDDTTVYSDATSMKPLFYYENIIFSSHEIVIKEALQDEFDIKLKKHLYHMKNILDYSNTQGIYKCNPNLYYSFKKEQFIRFYPREEFRYKELYEVLQHTEKYFDSQIHWLDKNYDEIFQSLTGGFDSKFSLSLTKPLVNKIKYFTYMLSLPKGDYKKLNAVKRIYYKDKYIVDQLIYNFNLNHQYYFFDDYKIPNKYKEELSEHVTSNHSYALSYLIQLEFPKNSIHVKSTLYELVKQPYNSDLEMKTSDEDMVKVIKNWSPKELKNDLTTLREMYKDFYNRNMISMILEKNYNLPMMLYWESRMGNWHSSLTQETDTVMETFILINNRYMINEFMSLKKSDKENKLYLTNMIKKFWPALNYFIPNSFSTLEDK